jgi:hypothetical protein
VVVAWGTVTQMCFIDEPGQPNIPAFDRFEIHLTIGRRTVPLFKGPERRRYGI